ncbi:tRNA 2-selenouridine(34) synthase MnmH [Gorillibacterium sp. sgz500922]|uniref:tRNA 2-selenouridine(34) synthase MnmH n=1 Tax=Gorillibacterium sp. sgz500922 TaxID=3446694 RepID=UPI003F66EB40
MFQDITIEEARTRPKPVSFIDVRSPSEFADATIPGAVNIPLFDDGERAEVGTLYAKIGVQAAKERGLALVSAKLPAFVKELASVPGDKAVFCWRGGMRSRTAATVASLMDIHLYRLNGGYRAYRNWVVQTLESFRLSSRPYVIHGLTGTGKTALLLRLKERGYPVIDLEGLAGHRGSVFGQIGLKPHNQKTFDSLLLEELLRWQDSPYLLLEAESKRIGRIVVPPFLAERMEQAVQIRIELPLEARVEQILADYRPQEHAEESLAAFRHIKDRIHIPVAAEIERSLLEERYANAASLLLRYYYDPRYEFSANRYGFPELVTFQAASPQEAEEAVAAYLSAREGPLPSQ